MIAYFDKDENKQKLYDSIQAWKGTPFWNNGRNKNGVDCVGLLAEILKELGVIKKYGDKKYPKDWWQNTDEEILEKNLFLCCKVREKLRIVEIPSPEKSGDIVLLSLQCTVLNHCAIYIYEDLLFHAHYRLGVILDNYTRLKHLRKKVYRIYEE